jgi:Leucine-rich repeat (LRR) protein
MLQIDGANITRIPSPAIHPQLASKLRTLIIQDNNIREIEEGAFDNLPMLKYLEISDANLTNDIIKSQLVLLLVKYVIFLAG